MPFRLTSSLAALLLATSLFAQSPAKRLLTADDVYRTQYVHDIQVSPEGKWISYTLTTVDRKADKRRNAVWMVNWEGTQDLPLTAESSSDSSARWSPDGKYLAFMSARPADTTSQIWLLDRRGGEARQLTNVKGEIDDYRWSPDSNRLMLEMAESEDAGNDATDAKPRVAKPIVTDRFHFKRDVDGYLTALAVPHIYLFDIESKKLEALTGNKNEEGDAEWSADGSQIAFVASQLDEPDQSSVHGIFVVDARAGAQPRKLVSTFSPNGQKLAWSPDGKQIAFLQGLEAKYNAYNMNRLAVIPAAGGTPKILTAQFDRGASDPEFTADGSALTFLVEDDRRAYLAKLAAGGNVEHVNVGNAVLMERESGGGHTALIAATDASAADVYALENGNLRKLTSHNDALLSELQLGAVEDISFHSKDGTEVHGMVIKPPSYEAGKKYPTLLWIHGGPNMQDDHALSFSLYPLQLERQYFAAHGYVVLAINYRGGSGRGAEYTRSIFADWGNKEVADLLAGIDYAVQKGFADPERLGIGGWSYGGILTDYTIATDSRFKAAISGAGSANQISMYGSDQYIVQYHNELGPPWRTPDLWMKLSYPFFHADRIHTPTLFVGGQDDFNVPIIGSEQMYQALRTLKVPTQLVIYPGQHHLLTRPSYIHDRLERYVAWFDTYLKNQK
ncbi:MAG: S9 family peptidase [Acidobacteria bacterium]|nr:S9 family peptidase [Acidobacteriota bacterium]